MIRIELWKAFHQKTLYIVLGIGILLALLDSLEKYLKKCGQDLFTMVV